MYSLFGIHFDCSNESRMGIFVNDCYTHHVTEIISRTIAIIITSDIMNYEIIVNSKNLYGC